MANPKVSIIMGIYNCEKYLENAVESVLFQTFTDWELIMCDDGSTDSTYEVAYEFVKKYPQKIKLLKNDKNRKLAYSLNHCLKNSVGEYIARMDADDVNMPDRLEKQVEFLIQHPEIACVGTGMQIFSEKGIGGIRYYDEYPNRYTMVHCSPFPHPTIMMRKSVYQDLGGYTVSKDTMRAEDIDLWFRFFEKGYKGYVIQKPLYRYRESIKDYSKRTIKAAIGTSKVYLRGYKKLKYPWYTYPYAFKPILAALLPKKFMYLYHEIKDKRSRE